MPMNRRDLLGAAAATAAVSSLPRFAFAADDRAKVYAEIEKRHGEAVARLQDWVRNPTIAAEGRGVETGVAQMMSLAKDAGFQTAVRMPTSGVPGVFATLDAGAPKTVGLYFMYDVKQADPAEWTIAPPFEAPIVDKPGFGKVLVGRGAVNQKGPESAFLAALHAFRGAGVKLPVNLVLVAEGEEEIGSPHIPEIVRRPEVLAALGEDDGRLHARRGPGSRRLRARSRSAPRASSSWSSSRAARSGAAARRRTSTPRTARASTAPRSTSCRRSRRS